VGLILVTARIEARTAQRRELAQALLQWAAATRREAGAQVADVYEDVGAANVFCVVSQWATRPAFEAHLRGSAFGSMLGAVELLADQSGVAVTEATDASEASTTLRRLRDSRRQGLNDSDVANL
jgi:quinol monooxygenase YgiN